MALTSYPNITITSSRTTLTMEYNNSIITSTYSSSVFVVITSALPAGFDCWVYQLVAGLVGAIADTGATINWITGGPIDTTGQYGFMKITAVTDGNFIAA